MSEDKGNFSGEGKSTDESQVDNLEYEAVEKKNEIEFLEILSVIAKYKSVVVGVPLIFGALSAIFSFLIVDTYTGKALMMPPQQDQSSAQAVIGQLIGGSMSAGGGISAALGLKNPNDLYVGILKSRSISDRLITRFNLREVYGQDTLADITETLSDNTSITAGKDGLIKIEVDDSSPARASALANAYVEELEVLTEKLAVSEASKRRQYYGGEVEKARRSLALADLAFKDVQERTGLIKPDDQATAIFQIVATLRGTIFAKEVEIGAMRTFSTDKNPEYLRALQELLSLKKQLAGLERENRLGGGDILVPTGKIPKAGMELLEKFRDVKYYETVYELVAKQAELAKIDEGKNATIIQLVDESAKPDKKSKPFRLLIVILTTILSSIFVIFIIFVLESLAQSRSDFKKRQILCRIESYLRHRWI